MSTNGISQNQSYGGASFEPMAYDENTIEPDAHPGQYEASIADGELKVSKTKGQPMIQLEWKLESTEDETCQKSVGATLRDWIVFSNDKNGNRGKVKVRTLREKFGVDVDLSTVTPESVNEFIAAIKGQTMTVWVSSRVGNDGQPQTNVDYTAPRSAGMAPMGSVDDEEEAPPTKATKAPAKKPAAVPAKKTAGRR